MTDHATAWSWQEQAPGSGSGAADWPTLYAQYLMRSASQSAKSTDLYQQIMEYVANGRLTPTVFRDKLPAFVQTHGTDYANELAEINTRFFSGMVELNTEYSHDVMDVVLPGASIPPVSPPAFDAADPIKWFQQLTEYATELNAVAVASYQSLLARVAAGQAAPGRVQEASTDYLNQRLPDYLRRLSSLYFDLLNRLNDLRSNYEADFLTGVLGAAKAPDQDLPVALNLIAPVGGMTSASLTLTNTQDQPAIIRGSVTDIRRADGVGPAFTPKIIIAPDALELRPGEEASVILSVQLNEDDYTPDVLYVGAVHIMRQGEPRVEVPLRIRATPAAPAAAPSRQHSSTKDAN